MSELNAVTRFALKEWAVVCAALERGQQSILLRKGGIEEGPEGFVPEHGQFWLMPTRFHQSADELTDDGASLLTAVESAKPPQGVVRLGLYAVVERVLRIDDRAALERLEGLHILSGDTVQARYDYRKPGLWVLLVRVYQRDEPYELSETPHFAGCKSWVDLRNKLPTDGLSPVLNQSDFEQVARDVERLVPGV